MRDSPACDCVIGKGIDAHLVGLSSVVRKVGLVIQSCFSKVTSFPMNLVSITQSVLLCLGRDDNLVIKHILCRSKLNTSLENLLSYRVNPCKFRTLLLFELEKPLGTSKQGRPLYNCICLWCCSSGHEISRWEFSLRRLLGLLPQALSAMGGRNPRCYFQLVLR